MMDEFWTSSSSSPTGGDSAAGGGGAEASDDEKKEGEKDKPTSATADVDVSKALEEELKDLRAKSRRENAPFKRVDIGSRGTLYMVATEHAKNENDAKPLPTRVYDTVRAIMDDVDKTRRCKSRWLNRFLPVEDVCVAKLDDIKACAAPIIARHFGDPNDTAQDLPVYRYAVIYDHRICTKLDRLGVINAVVDSVPKRHVVNLDRPQIVIIVTHVKNSAAITVVHDYYELAKWNMSELAKPPEERMGQNEREKRLAEKEAAKKRKADDKAEEEGADAKRAKT